MMRDKLAVKPGDQVFVGRTGRSELCAIERVTPSGRFFVRRNENWLQEFNADGFERGSEVGWRDYATIATPEMIVQHERERAREDLISQIRRINWNALTLGQLQQMMAIITPPA